MAPSDPKPAFIHLPKKEARVRGSTSSWQFDASCRLKAAEKASSVEYRGALCSAVNIWAMQSIRKVNIFYIAIGMAGLNAYGQPWIAPARNDQYRNFERAQHVSHRPWLCTCIRCVAPERGTTICKMISACLRKQAAREEGARLLALLIFPNMPIMIAGTYFRGCKIGLRSAPNSPIVNAIVQRLCFLIGLRHHGFGAFFAATISRTCCSISLAS
jgi:hypothetical protein